MLTDDRTLRAKNQARAFAELVAVTASLALFGMWASTPVLSAAETGSVGELTGRRLPGESNPPWKKDSGTARESIEDGHWMVREPKSFCRRLVLGDYQQTDGQKNEVRFEWGTDCRDNHRADGLSIHTQGRRLRFIRFTASTVPTCCWWVSVVEWDPMSPPGTLISHHCPASMRDNRTATCCGG